MMVIIQFKVWLYIHLKSQDFGQDVGRNFMFSFQLCISSTREVAGT